MRVCVSGNAEQLGNVNPLFWSCMTDPTQTLSSFERTAGLWALLLWNKVVFFPVPQRRLHFIVALKQCHTRESLFRNPNKQGQQTFFMYCFLLLHTNSLQNLHDEHKMKSLCIRHRVTKSQINTKCWSIQGLFAVFEYHKAILEIC